MEYTPKKFTTLIKDRKRLATDRRIQHNLKDREIVIVVLTGAANGHARDCTLRLLLPQDCVRSPDSD